jgi:hypothetical protein
MSQAKVARRRLKLARAVERAAVVERPVVCKGPLTRIAFALATDLVLAWTVGELHAACPACRQREFGGFSGLGCLRRQTGWTSQL